MTLITTFSFDDELTTARIIDRQNLTVQAAGRTGKCIRMVAGGSNDASDMYANILIPASTATLTVGFAFKPDGNGHGSSDGRFLAFRSTTGPVDHVVCYFDRLTGAVSALVGATVVGTTAAGALTLNQWNYVEASILVADSGGTFDLWVNGVNLITFSGDTRNGGASAAVNCIRLMGRRSSTVCDFDDFYVLDNTGSVNNTRLGEISVECIRPNGNGNSSQWVGSDGNSTDNYALVDEVTPDSADYVQSSTTGQKDTYAYSNLTAAAGTVAAVQMVAFATKTPGGAAAVKQVARVGGVEVDGPTQDVTAGWKPLVAVLDEKPGGGAWTITDVNAAEFGVKVA